MPLHTLMFGWEYPPKHCGGLGVACQGIVQGLLHHGAEVTLVLPHDDGIEDGANIVSSNGITGAAMFTIPSGLHPYDSFQSYAIRLNAHEPDLSEELYGSNLGEEVERYTAAAVALTKSMKPDVIHTHDWMTLEAGVRAAKYHRKPLVAHVHATELDRTEFHPNPWILKREMAGLKKADHIIAVSGYTRELLIRDYGIPEHKITVLHNGSSDVMSPPRAIGPMQHHPMVLFLGRLTVQKGATYFLKAAEQIHRIKPDVRFVIAGDGYLLPQLISEACDRHLQDCIVFAGRVASDEAKKLYARADCFVMPSVSEPFGLVAIEAITHGAPVVLSRQSGASEIVKNALLTDFWDTDKMADCILTVLREAPLRDQMRSETPRILSTYTWNNQGQKIMSLYEQLRINF